MPVSDPWSDKWSPAEGRRFWDGYEDFLDRVCTVGDDEKTICMEVFARA